MFTPNQYILHKTGDTFGVPYKCFKEIYNIKFKTKNRQKATKTHKTNFPKKQAENEKLHKPASNKIMTIFKIRFGKHNNVICKTRLPNFFNKAGLVTMLDILTLG